MTNDKAASKPDPSIGLDRVDILTAALEAIVDRSHNGELGTSKVMDMRRIAEEALYHKR